MQINFIFFIFNDSVRILCLSCNIKRSKTTAKLSENSWSVDLSAFKCVICDVNAYTVTDFCVAQHESDARNDSVTVYSKKYPDNAI
jgi:hypothetical protein